MLNMLNDSHYISSVDLRSAFWQIPLDDASKEKTAFTVPGRGLYQFKVLPFGLANAAQCQQRLMDAIFGPELEPNLFVYLDDIIIIIISKTLDEHVKLLREVILRLEQANLTINIDKCEFCHSSLKYLGFIVDGQGLRTDEEKVLAMVNFPRPTNTTEVKRFVGLCSWYRRFVSHFATLVAPINSLLKNRKKGQKIQWTKESDEAFVKMKQASILSSPDFLLPFCIQCDASDVGLGCVLTQHQHNEEKVSEWKLLVPRSQRKKSLDSCHDDPKSAHLGSSKTFSRIALNYYWPKMRQDRYVRACKTCNSQKSSNVRFGFMGAEKKARFPFQMILIDLMGPFPRSTNSHLYLLVITDWYTKYTVLHPLRAATSTSIVRFLEDQVFLVYGVPQYIFSDNGSQFTSNQLKKLALEYKVRIWFTPLYHAQDNFVERTNRTIGAAIRSYINENYKSWDQQIAKIGYALRTAVHEITGFSPAFLNFGRIIPASGDYYGKVYRYRYRNR